MMDNAVTSQIVRPSDTRWETWLLAAATIGLVLFVFLYTFFLGREDSEQQLADWQISAYSDLVSEDQAVFNQLLVAAQDIYWMHEESARWPEPRTLRENFLPPFYQDSTADKSGSLEWRLLDRTPAGEDQGIVLYHGSRSSIPGQGAWLMVINHSHAGNEQISDISFWRHDSPEAAPPGQVSRSSLVLEGWKQVIPYRGEEEVERLNAG